MAAVCRNVVEEVEYEGEEPVLEIRGSGVGSVMEGFRGHVVGWLAMDKVNAPGSDEVEEEVEGELVAGRKWSVKIVVMGCLSVGRSQVIVVRGEVVLGVVDSVFNGLACIGEREDRSDSGGGFVLIEGELVVSFRDRRLVRVVVVDIEAVSPTVDLSAPLTG